MTSYRRNFVPGGSYFFTVNLWDRRSGLLTEYVDALRVAFRETRARHPFAIDAIVILPDHLHAIWTLPEGDADFALRWRLIKAAFSRTLPRGEAITQSRADKGERGSLAAPLLGTHVAQRSRRARHVDYIHFNPVKHGHVTRVRDGPHSSFHRMVKFGVYPDDWAGDLGDPRLDFGERR